LLLPQLHRRSGQVETAAPLETPEQVARSIERDRALSIRARREREQTSSERDRFELTRDKIVFGLQAGLAIVVLAAALIILVINPELIPVTVLGGGALNKVARVLCKRPST
jgi:hypothetical protein